MWSLTHSTVKKEFSNLASWKGSSLTSFSCSELGGQAGLKHRSSVGILLMEERESNQSTSTSSVCDAKNKRKTTKTLLSSVPPAMGRWKVLIPRKPGSDLKSPFLYHVQGSASFDDITSHLFTSERGSLTIPVSSASQGI